MHALSPCVGPIESLFSILLKSHSACCGVPELEAILYISTALEVFTRLAQKRYICIHENGRKLKFQFNTISNLNFIAQSALQAPLR